MHAGSVLNVATLVAAPGDRVELRDVLLISDGDNVTVGNPIVAQAMVVAEVMQHGKGKKVVNFKYKAKVRYRRKRGHRQAFTALIVREVHLGDQVEKHEPDRQAAEAPEVTTSEPTEPIGEQMESITGDAAIEEAIEEQAEAAPEETPADEAAPRRRRRASGTAESGE